MASVRLQIEDPAMRMTLGVMLKAAGHRLADADAQVTIADTVGAAIKAAGRGPTLVLAAASTLSEAVDAMRQGVYGYIFVPLQPGEAPLMVERAAAGTHRESTGVTPEGAAASDATLSQVERHHIERVLRECKGNQVKAALKLGIGRNTLWRKLKQYQGSQSE